MPVSALAPSRSIRPFCIGSETAPATTRSARPTRSCAIRRATAPPTARRTRRTSARGWSMCAPATSSAPSSSATRSMAA